MDWIAGEPIDALMGRCVTPVGRRAAEDVRDVGGIAFRLPDGRACTFAERDGAITITPGAAAPTVVDLAEAAWRDFAGEMATAAGLLYGGRARLAAGSPADLERWEPALRALFQGRQFFDAAAATFRDRAGGPLDLRRAYARDDPPEDLRHALHEAGFLRVRDVFAPAEIARLRAAVAAEAARAVPDDGHSWWAVRRDGSRVLCRLIYLGLRVPAIAALSDDPRLAALAALAPEPLRPALDRADGHTVVVKNADVASGLSDLPWHRDCGLGGHPVTCPTLNVGVQLDAASAAAGRLEFLPGSHRGSVHRTALARPGLSVVPMDTEAGDVTVHVGCVLHAAPPPAGDGPARRTLYVSFMPQRAYDVIPPGRSYNDVIRSGPGRAA